MNLANFPTAVWKQYNEKQKNTLKLEPQSACVFGMLCVFVCALFFLKY